MLHERSNIAASLAEHLQFQEKWLLHKEFEWIVANQDTVQKMKLSIKDFFGKCDQIRTLCNEKEKLESEDHTFWKCYIGYSIKEAISLLLLWSTKNFNKKVPLQKHFGWIVVNQNRETRIRALCILKLLCTRCSTEVVIPLLLSQST